jgi:hypothetical protein
VRVRLVGHLSRARIPFHVDVNVGDPIVPPPGQVEVRLLPLWGECHGAGR